LEKGFLRLGIQEEIECEAIGLPPRGLSVGPEIVHGIEINPLAAELARTTIWIGDIQWGLRNGIYARPSPILRKLDAIECRDAILSPNEQHSASEAPWPSAEFIVGNPPFLGGKLMRDQLGDETVERLFKAYDGRVSREADLVCYWFEKARAAIKAGHTRRAGLVATNSIRGGANRRVLDEIVDQTRIFEAWSDEPWVVEGAAVRVSIICFGADHDTQHLNGHLVAEINSDLTGAGLDLTKARRLADNSVLSFQGVKFGGPFEISSNLAREFLAAPLNPNGRPNSDVVKRWCNGMDITRRREDRWCIDFEPSTSERQAALYELPFHHLRQAFEAENELRERDGKRPLRFRETRTAATWWIHQRPREDMRKRLNGLSRFIVTPEVAKYRLFMFFEPVYLTSGSVYAITRDDNTTFGILHSRFHAYWSLRLGTTLEDRPRYTPSTTFETFPFPNGLTPNLSAAKYADDPRAIAIASAAEILNNLRNAWLNPPDLVRVEPEVVAGYPDRIVPIDAVAATTLRERTLTNLYNEHPQWLVNAHRDLDAAVAAAYGWPSDISEEDALAELLELNLSRAAAGNLFEEGEALGPIELEELGELDRC
jgi:type II restriction/modification system DNA methylase subunit YeeA